MKPNRETAAPRFSGIGGHHSARAGTVEWLTPPDIIEALGGWRSIGRDPCAPIIQPYPTAVATWTILDDGLSKRWDPAERFFMNPPYENGVIELWLAMLADQGNGTALIFARTETAAFHRFCWQRAHAALFQYGRINFHIGESFSDIKTKRTFLAGDRAPGNAGAPTVLLAYGEQEAERLSECGIEGKFVPLIFSRSVLVSIFGPSNEEEKINMTWRQLVVDVMREHEGPIEVGAVWSILRNHPKAHGKEHGRAKVRQILQRVGERVERGQYRLAI